MADIRTVAALAGVSVATVSRALSAPDKLRPETLARVTDAIARTGYNPNARAQGLRRQRSRTVMVIVNDLPNPFIASVVRAIEDRARAAGYCVLIGDSQRCRTHELAYGTMATRGIADGIIQFGPRPPFGTESDLARFPVVSVLDCFHHPSVPTVQIDNRAAAEDMMARLIGLGHRRIALITGPVTSSQSHDRADGARAAFAGHFGHLEGLVATTGDYSAESGRLAMAALLDSPARRPTAVFCFNDLMAIGAMKAIGAAGLAVPADISVAGFDDIEVARFLAPALATVRQPAQEIGTVAFDLLEQRIASPAAAVSHVRLPHAIREGESLSRPGMARHRHGAGAASAMRRGPTCL